MIAATEIPSQQQALIAAPVSMRPGSQIWSPGLGKLLLDGSSDPKGAVRLIAINPTLRKEAEAILPALELAKAPATAVEILAILVRQAPAYGVTAKSDEEWDWFFDAYVRALMGLPRHAIEDAFNRWNRGEGHNDMRMAGFFPKAPQLYLLADKANRELIMAAYRAKKALEYREQHVKPEVTGEERAAIKEQFTRLAGQLGAGRSIPEVPRPTRSAHQVAEDLRARAGEIGDVI